MRKLRTISLCSALFFLLLDPALSAEVPAKPAVAGYTRTVYLVRHGAYLPDAKADPEFGPGLTALGIAQARLTAARLRGLPVRFDSITSSTMTRAKQTAAIIHETLTDVPVDATPLISECTPPALPPLEGESSEEMAKCSSRLDAAFTSLLAPPMQADRNELLVAHGNVIRYLVARALKVDSRAWLGMSVAHASVTVIRVRSDGSMRVLAVGDTGHIPPNLLSWGTDEDPQLIVH